MNRLIGRDIVDSFPAIELPWNERTRRHVQKKCDYSAVLTGRRGNDSGAESGSRDKAGRARVAATKTLVSDTQVEARFERRRLLLEATDASRQIAEKAQAIYGELGRQFLIDDTGNGGGTDAAFAAASGLPGTLESFGLVGYGFHSSEDEYVDLDSIEPRLYLLTRLVMDDARER
jgi:acetylornithine deacetylase/succinyl-diaminopimelate desuccinylase-like protein